ncbi:MAG: hypothetical protein LBQ52_02000, partial [Helicobacteraceae bacterium]|nr:hypothetical protein [Helicobacteraceae bacterium]
DISTDVGAQINEMMQRMDGLEGKRLPDTWWIADRFCDNRATGGATEPNGDYNPKTWLSYRFGTEGASDNGMVLSCNDAPVAAYGGYNMYTHQSYTCVGLDSYFAVPIVGDLVPQQTSAWDATLDPAKDAPATFTKMAKQTYLDPVTKKSENRGDIQIKIAPADIEVYTGLLCAKLKVKDLTSTNAADNYRYYKPSSISGADPSAPVLAPDETNDGYKCASVIGSQNLKTDPIVFSWSGDFIASPEVSVEVLASNCKTIDQMKENPSVCDTNPSTASYFTLRPSFEGEVYEGKLISGKLYGDPANLLANPPINPLPNGFSASATIGYKRASGAQPCFEDDGLCVQAIDKKPSIGDVSAKVDANISFTGIADISGATKARFHKLGYDNVGEIELWLLDNEWTIVDQNASNYDCVDGSDSMLPDFTGAKATNANWGKIGCVVKHKIGEVVIDPYELNVTKMTIKSALTYASASGGATDSSFVYYANFDEVNLSASPLNSHRQFAIVEINAEALNAKGAVTDLYEEGNYSKEITHDMGFMGSNENDMPSEVIGALWGGYWDEANATTGAITPSSVWKKGEAKELKYLFNFGRDLNTPMPVLFMKAKDANPDFNLTLTEKDNNKVTGSAAWTEKLAVADGFKQIDFIYGRAHLGDVSTEANEANVSYVIDYFSNNNGSNEGVRSLFNNPSALASSVGWYNIPRVKPFDISSYTDGDTKGTISSDFGDGTVNKPNMLNGDVAKFDYAATKPRPRRFISHLDIPSYLWHHPFGKSGGYNKVEPLEVGTRRGCFEHPCGVIEFLAPVTDGWGGVGERDDGRHYEDDSKKSYMPYRLGR